MQRPLQLSLDSIFGLGTSTAGVSAVCMTRKFNDIRILQAQDFLEAESDILQDFLALGSRASFGALVSWKALADSASPQTDTVEALADVDDHAHDLVVVVVLESFANGGELCV